MIKEIKIEPDGSITVNMNLHLKGSMLEKEEEIARVVNELGRAATEEALRQFDTDGRPVVVGNEKYTSKGAEKKSTKRPTGKRR